MPAVHVQFVTLKDIDAEPPSIESLKYFGRGVSKAQAEALQKSTKAALVMFAYPTEGLFDSLEQANRMIQELALQTDGLIWDAETRELFSPAEWSARRITPRSNGFPDVTTHRGPFDTPDGGTEWMWVEVTTWKGDAIGGLLSNEPANVPGLHAGATVKIREQDVFDYLRVKPDGTQEGNETSREIEKAQKARSR